MYNETLRPFRETIVAVEKQLSITYSERARVCVCVCSLRYSVCNAHAPYGRLWPVRLYSIFPHYVIKSKIFEKKKGTIKCVF
jgi:hypothetical protein